MTEKPPPELQDFFNDLKKVPARDPRRAAQGKAEFLSQAAFLRKSISGKAKPRLNPWKVFTFQKNSFALNTVLVLIIIAVFSLTGAATTAYAAQDDLPGDSLYPIKIGAEDLKLWINSNPQSEVYMLMDMSETRVQEVIALREAGRDIPAIVNTRLESQIREALSICAGLDDARMRQSLLFIHTSMQTQEQILTSNGSDQLTEQMQTMLQAQLQLVEGGLQDPEVFRNVIRNEDRNRLQYQDTATPVTSATISPEKTPSGNGSGMENNNQGEGPSLNSNDNGNNSNTDSGNGGNPDTGEGNDNNNNDIGNGAGNDNGNDNSNGVGNDNDNGGGNDNGNGNNNGGGGGNKGKVAD